MAIKNVPKISGPSYGGVIYGLNLNVGYSSQPSKLTLDIVNSNGIYSTPSLMSQTSVHFGDFSFNGIVWDYTIKESAGERTLQVTLVDNSIILDQYYVILWKRGLFGLKGQEQRITKTFDFGDTTILVPQKNTRTTGFPITEFIEKRLGRQSITSSSRRQRATRVGSVIVLGTEKFATSACDIPDTYYTFDDLKSAIPVQGNFPSNNTWRSTHEGTLREVLSNWASDLGFDFFWNFSSNRVQFFDASNAIASIPNIELPNIISKETSATMEGTFKQYGVGYTAVPKSPVKTLSFTRSNVILYTVSPYNISYFITKIGAPQALSRERSKWGGNRNQDDFVQAAFLGFVARSLRDLYCFQKKHWEPLGYQSEGIAGNKSKIISALKKFGYEEMISNLESFDKEGLPNYDFAFISRDPTLSDKWHETEQKLLQYYGRYYRIPDSSGSFFYCNANYTIEIEISVDPEGQYQEENSEQFAGKKILERGGEMSHDEISAQEALNYNKLTKEIQNCAPLHMDLKESGLLDSFITSQLITSAQAEKVNTLVIYPNSDKFVKNKIGFSYSLSRGLHPLERSFGDQKTANIASGKKNCKDFEDKLKKGSCESYEDIARNNAIKAVGGGDQKPLDDFVSGLVNTSARFSNISLKNGGNVKLYAPSDGSLQVVCRYNLTVNKISTDDVQEFLWSEGTPGNGSGVAEIRVSMENVTDPNEDVFQKRRKSPIIKPANSSCTTPQRKIKYVFAGEPTINLSPSNGLSSLDVSLSSDGFTSTVVFSTRPEKIVKADNSVRKTQSQLNRASFNAS